MSKFKILIMLSFLQKAWFLKNKYQNFFSIKSYLLHSTPILKYLKQLKLQQHKKKYYHETRKQTFWEIQNSKFDKTQQPIFWKTLKIQIVTKLQSTMATKHKN